MNKYRPLIDVGSTHCRCDVFALHLDVRVYVHIRKYMVRCCASAPRPQWHGPQVAMLLASVLLAVLLLPLARRSIELELLVSLLLLPALELELLLVILLLPLPKLQLGRTSSTRTINPTSTCTFTTASSSSSTTIVITTRISRTSTTTPPTHTTGQGYHCVVLSVGRTV